MATAPMIVVTEQTTATGAQPGPYQVSPNVDDSSYADKIEDLNTFAWLSCILCNFCGCGLIGFIMTQVGNIAKEAGHFKFAYFTSIKARKWLIAAVVFGSVTWIILIIYYVAAGAVLIKNLNTSN